jgi:hypothetical protein
MAKPILIINVPMITREQYLAVSDSAKQATDNEYHVLIYTGTGSAPDFKVLNAEDLTPLQFEELKSIVEKTIAA